MINVLARWQGVLRLVDLSRPVVEAGVHDARNATALVLANFTYQPIDKLDVRLPVARRVQGVRSVEKGPLAFSLEDAAMAFAGRDCDRIRIDGRETVFVGRPMPLVAWAPVPDERKVKGGVTLIVRAGGKGNVRIPAPGLRHTTVCREGRTPGSRGTVVESRMEDGQLVFGTTGGEAWYYVVQVGAPERNLNRPR